MKKYNIIKLLLVFTFFMQVIPMNLSAEEIKNEEQLIEEISAEENAIGEEPIEEIINDEDQGIELIDNIEDESIDNIQNSDMSELARGATNLSIEKSFSQIIRENLFTVTSIILIIILAGSFLLKRKKQNK